jgi:ABC-type sugar transport system permease subunit
MLEYTDGIVNALARISGMHILDQYWLSDPNLAMFSVMAVSIYIVGIPIMYYTSDISTLNNSIFEAARIDGANLFQIIILILHPLLNRTHKAIVLSLLLVGFREMERVFLMTNGGPGGSTEIIGTYIYHNIRQPGGNLGFVSSVGVLVLLFALAIAIVQIFNGRQPTGSAE